MHNQIEIDPARPPREVFPEAEPLAPEKSELRRFALVAVLSGWTLLGTGLATGQALEPFVLLTLAVGLVLPAMVLTPRGRRRRLLGDAVGRPRHLAWLVPAGLAVPVGVWLLAAATGSLRDPGPSLVATYAVTVLSSLLIVNIWEEMAWTGFAQRRAASRYGALAGALVVATLFAGLHLPLALVGADDGIDVLLGVLALAVSGVGLRLAIGGLDRVGGPGLLAVALLHASFNGAAVVVEADHDWIRYLVIAVLGALAVPLLRRDA